MSFRPLTLAAGALLALGLALPGAAAQTLTEVSPAEGTRGTVVTLTGTELGGKPKVWLTREGDKKKYKLKVAKGGTDSEVQAELKKAVAGEFTLHVRPKGKGAEELTTSFTVLGPSVVDVTPSTAGPGDEVVLRVANAGTAKPKPKVEIGGVKAKVTSVEEEAVGFQGAGLFTLISVIMPKKIANGTWDIFLDNKVAQEIEEAALQITGSDVKIGKPELQLSVDGGSVKLNKKTFGSSYIEGRLQVQGGGGNKPNKSIVLMFLFDPEAATPFEVSPSIFNTVLYTEIDAGAGFPPPVTIWGSPLDDYTITINSISGGQAAGSYEGSLSSAGEPNRMVSGSFVADL